MLNNSITYFLYGNKRRDNPKVTIFSSMIHHRLSKLQAKVKFSDMPLLKLHTLSTQDVLAPLIIK